jgi:glycogen synthase
VRGLDSNEMNDGIPEPKPSVLLLGPYPPPHGGVEISLASLQDYLHAHEIGCEVINLTRHRKAQGGGVHYPASAMEVIRLILQKKAEIIHVHIGGNISWRLLGLGLFCSLLPDRKLVLTLHSGGYPLSPPGKAARPISLRGFFFRRFDGLIGVNQELVCMFAKFGVPASRIRLILPFALPASVPNVDLPDTLHNFLKTHSPILLSVNGLEHEYDLPLQIEVLGRVREIHRDAGLLIIGTGSCESEIRHQVQTQPYADHIVLSGDVPHDVVLRVMSLSDILLRTTLYDGDSIAVREALHFGLPVVATDNGMRPDGVTLIPISDLEALSRAVQRCLEKPRVCQTSPVADARNLQAVAELYQELLSSTFERTCLVEPDPQNVSSSKYV